MLGKNEAASQCEPPALNQPRKRNERTLCGQGLREAKLAGGREGSGEAIQRLCLVEGLVVHKLRSIRVDKSRKGGAVEEAGVQIGDGHAIVSGRSLFCPLQ